MSIDLQRILEAAAKAAVEEQAKAASASRKTKKRRLSTGRAILLGAGLATAGRLVVGDKGRDVLARTRERIADFTWPHDGQPAEVEPYDDELEDYESEPGVADDEEALADEDEEVADEPPDDDQEPEAGTDEDEEARETLEPEPSPRRARRQRGRA